MPLRTLRNETALEEEMLLDVLNRSRLEVTGEKSRAHLGMETQCQWSDLATRRSTPLLCGRSSLVTLVGHALHADGPIPVTPAAWSRKHTATFRDVLATVRRHRWGHETFYPAPTNPAGVFVPSSTFESWCRVVCSGVRKGQIAMSRRDTTTDAMSISEKVCRKSKSGREKKEGRATRRARGTKGAATWANTHLRGESLPQM
jgi:hypothetical protein